MLIERSANFVTVVTLSCIAIVDRVVVPFCVCVGMKNEEPFGWAMSAAGVSLVTGRARLIAPGGRVRRTATRLSQVN